MTEPDLPPDNIKSLAEEAMEEKREEVGGEDQARELWDIPAESAGQPAEQQESENAGRH